MVARLSTLLVTLLSWCLALLVAGLTSGCDSACKELAYKVCDCQPSRSKESRCDVAIESAFENQEPSGDEDDRCQSILDSGTCTCEAIEADNLSACGLSNDATSFWWQDDDSAP